MSIKITPRTLVEFDCSWCGYQDSDLVERSVDDPSELEPPDRWRWLSFTKDRDVIHWSLLCPTCCARAEDLANERTQLRSLPQSERLSQRPEDSIPPESFSDRTSVGTTIERCPEEWIEPDGVLQRIRLCCLPAGHDPTVPHQFTRKAT